MVSGTCSTAMGWRLGTESRWRLMGIVRPRLANPAPSLQPELGQDAGMEQPLGEAIHRGIMVGIMVGMGAGERGWRVKAIHKKWMVFSVFDVPAGKGLGVMTARAC